MSALVPLLRTMIERGASDLHLVVGKPPLLRLRGELVPLEGQPVLRAETAQAMIGEILSPDQKKIILEHLDLDFAYELADGAARFRVNVLWQHRGMGAVLRVIPAKYSPWSSSACPPW